MLHINKPYSTAWRVWNQLARIANAETERMVNYSNGMLAGAASERLMEECEFARLTSLANELADARRNQLRAGA